MVSFMGNYFDIDCEQDTLNEFIDDFNERIVNIEAIAISLGSQKVTKKNMIPLIGEINTIKNNAAETQNIPLSTILDSLEVILSGAIDKNVSLPETFAEFMMAIFEIAGEIALQAAEIHKIDFDLFSKIQNSLQPLGSCQPEEFSSTIELSRALLSDYDFSTSDVDLFESEESVDNDIELFDNENQTEAQSANISFEPKENGKLKDDLQVFRIIAEESNDSQSAPKIKLLSFLYLSKLMNAAAGNPVDPFQLEAAIYFSQMSPLFKNRAKKSIAKFHLIPVQNGWELASAITAFTENRELESISFDKSLGNQIRNGSQIVRICNHYWKISNGAQDKTTVINAINEISTAAEYSKVWVDLFKRIIEKAVNCLEKYNCPTLNNTSAKKILCVDDDKLTLKIFKHILEKENHIPLLADNYDDALELINIEKPDLIFLDLNMPGKGGYWLVEQKKHNDILKNIPIAIISGSNDDYGISTNDIVGFYNKPIGKDTLISIIDSLFN